MRRSATLIGIAVLGLLGCEGGDEATTAGADTTTVVVTTGPPQQQVLTPEDRVAEVDHLLRGSRNSLHP
jgi:hypothetical protein